MCIQKTYNINKKYYYSPNINMYKKILFTKSYINKNIIHEIKYK